MLSDPIQILDVRRRNGNDAQSESKAMLGDAGPSAKIADGDVHLSPYNYLHISVITRQKIEIRVSVGRRLEVLQRGIASGKKKVISRETRENRAAVDARLVGPT